ncbi:MAG: thiol-disulfide oxidoreductase DCC family protein [Anaerolineae bacterium]|nr:thiol-disulfide oxidoreductase DCC family protein [Anaerolineae bacterium]
MLPIAENPVVLFDGVCNLCSRTVQFIVPRNPQANLSFASLQSEFGQSVLAAYQLPEEEFDTILLLEGAKIYFHSSAILRLATYLRYPWRLAGVMLLVPRPIRDRVYNWVSRNRYRWFGKLDACLVPTPDLQARMIE